MVAEADRVDREKEREARERRPPFPLQQEQQRQRHDQRMERIDLGDDRLAPEGVRAGEQQRGGDRRQRRPGKLRRDEHDQPGGDRAFNGRCEIQRVRRFAVRRPQKEIADRKVQRIPIARRDVRRTDGGLKRTGIAEVDARQQRRPVQREDAERDKNGGVKTGAHEATGRACGRWWP